jgi:hypothetical protein
MKTKTTPAIPSPMPKKTLKQATPALLRRRVKNKSRSATTKMKRNLVAQ